jgi:hypothetical protein
MPKRSSDELLDRQAREGGKGLVAERVRGDEDREDEVREVEPRLPHK